MKTMLAGISMMLLITTGCKKQHSSTYSIDVAQSNIEWKGSSPSTENTGTFSVSGTDLKVRNGKLLDGTFEIPINSLNVTNLPPDLKPVLTAHLLSPDFFNVVVNPLGVFKIQKAEAFTGPQKEEDLANANALISGTLMMIGVTKQIQFPARINIANDKIQAEAFLQIDRTRWGMNYAADPDLGEHHIYPLVNLHIRFVATKN